MDLITYTTARNNLAKTIDKVNEDHTPVIITRQKGSAAVLVSLDDFNAYEETAYQMHNVIPVKTGIQFLSFTGFRVRPGMTVVCWIAPLV